MNATPAPSSSAANPVGLASRPLSPPEGAAPAPWLVGLLATGAGLAVASLYYAQPLLGVMASELQAPAAAVGWLPTLTQLGYALGIFFLAPLGDRHDRRQIILVKALLLTLALVLSALAPGLATLWLGSLAIGITATLAQDIVPSAATLAPAAQRGKIVGTVMTGLLLGILLSRVVSGVLAQGLGWRSVYGLAALSIAAFGLVAWRALPRVQPSTTLSYGALLASLGQLWRRHPTLRRATLAQGLLAVGFSAFWSTLALMLHAAPWHLGSAVAGYFGLAGAAGALAAPWVGRLADRQGPAQVTRLGAGLAALSFGAMLVIGGLPQSLQLWALALATVGFDLGVQAALVSHQTLVYGIDPGARSRLNAILFTGMFAGMASGAAGGSALLSVWGWPAVTILALLSAVAALGVRCWPAKPA
jgi:predicted MFS family arabinose efflux permease